ncbi:SIS domain-containing protein [Nonomuraea sediminis]|uniref:SIS domain-containing protein n=1 Tax=Nonomuraea sediminis TaxID=2835864 RepID=UPI001BDC0CBF|nr:SIS domain-containing protein [Nonomuraea sediminis]
MHDIFLNEILGQPAAIERSARALESQRPQLVRLAALASGARHVLLTGMGASHDACLAAASVLGSAGILATTVNTAELVHFRLPALSEDTLVVAISQSGRSAELVRLTRSGIRARLVTITNGVDNPLAAAANVALDTAAGPELGPSTMTFAATFPTLGAVVGAITGAGSQDPAAARVAADAARRVLDRPDELAATMAGWAGDRQGAVLVGRGTARAAADLGALVLKEAAGFAAECLDAAEFRHGPLELAGPGLAVAVVATEPETFALDVALAREVASHGAAVLLLAGEPVEAGVSVVPVGTADRLLMPGVAAIPFQVLAWRLAVAQGRDPGRFTVGNKITTRE